MNFEWDEDKNRVNVQEHGIDFADAGELFASPISLRKALRHERERYEQALRDGLGTY